ncbi:MAG: hypothetical protein PUJ27_04845 [Lachnobacterium sp.]|nr:hypothetical protein [Lachnobacterium sp.]MCI7533315.1 hypothetical protein [Lachnobacterium sp.]MDD7713215.1 hypothetical protein [Lachnobacterium sp.]MDY5461739.1 hypothetical protein [Agathobacter sp.]
MDHTENEQKAKRKQNDIGRFLAVAVLTIVLAAGYFLLWAYLSYELRLSAEVIRAGLVLLYIIPCWIGGRVLRRCMHGRTLGCGAVFGVLLYALLIGLHMAEGETITFTQTHVINCMLCVLSSVVGTLRFRNRNSKGI